MTVEKFDAHFTFREHPVECNNLLRVFSQRNIG
jgi:hypothetical protein